LGVVAGTAAFAESRRVNFVSMSASSLCRQWTMPAFCQVRQWWVDTVEELACEGPLPPAAAGLASRDYHNQKNAGERHEPNGAVNGAMTGMGQSRTKRVCAEDVGSTPHKRTKTEAGQLEGRRGSSTASSPLTGTCRLSLTSSPVNFFRRSILTTERGCRRPQGRYAGQPRLVQQKITKSLSRLAPLEPRTTIEQGTHFEGESRPSEDPLSASPEVPTVEPQLRNGRLDAVNSADR
jgi:hypothetical protein